MGSLVAALGSYLRARDHRGQWLVRMEDLDPLREIPGAADSILQSLEDHALYWDGQVVYQSNRHTLYQQALIELINNNQVYACTCTRKALHKVAKKGDYGMIYPGGCRHCEHPYEGRYAIRARTNDKAICFNDQRLGRSCQQLRSQLGDFIIKRSDGYFAYQLAVVVDDEAQGITEIVRGEDLFDNTPRQIHLQQLLGYSQPEYYHLPMVINQQGQKLSKQTHAPPLNAKYASKNIIQALSFLGGYNLDDDNPQRKIQDAQQLRGESPESILQWAIQQNHTI